MATLFCAPNRFDIQSADQAINADASNLSNYQFPGLVWRSEDLNNVFIIVRQYGAWDTAALIGSNLRATDTIRFRAANTTTALTDAPFFDQTVNAWQGVAPASGALTLTTLPTVRAYNYLRLDINSPGNPDGFIQAQSLVIGLSFNAPGLDVGATRTIEDMSAIEDGLGYTAVNPQGVRVGWKVTMSGLKEADYEGVWFPFSRKVGNKQPFLFVEDDDPNYLQNRAALCRMTGTVKGSASASDYYVVDATLKSVS